VDDQPPIRALIAHSLQALGLPVIEAGDGVAALERLRETPVRAVFCDIQMPRLDGAGFLQQLRAQMSPKDLPVIMISGEDDRETIARLLALGANDYIVKPFSFHTLEVKTRQALGLPPPPPAPGNA
jgi:chemosensory pili system protein ChpA (sensor histidine kinase/response regulator)